MKPETIIKIINKEFDTDISTNSQKRIYSDLRCIYFYLAQRYCLEYSLEEIGYKVGKKHANVVTMTERFIERINTRGYEYLTRKLKKAAKIVEENHKEDEDVILALKIQEYPFIQLQKQHAYALRSNKNLKGKIKTLKDSLNKLQNIEVVDAEILNN